MSFTNDGTFCSACGVPIDTKLDKADERQPCSKCAATARTINVSITEAVTARAGLGVKAKHQGDKKPFIEDLSLPSFSVNRQKLVHHQRVIDRDKDIYLEKVTDYETGELIHECEEPLSSHTSHGSAKKNQGKSGG